MRSLSRTDDTSGLVTTRARSAYFMAIAAPFSMPAGLSQMIQSNFSRSSSITFSTPSSSQGVLVAGLAGGEQGQRLHPLVAYQRLRELRLALHHVDQVEHHAPLRAQHQVEVAQTDVEIDHHHLLARLAPAPPPARRSTWSCRRHPCRTSPPGPCHPSSTSHARSRTLPVHDLVSSRPPDRYWAPRRNVCPSSQACAGLLR